MRSLRKIIFINSAHIRYAEVMLDGNVHFIGTQGVGKSTLLRAILFFYNADKTHLGIPKEMKSFDEFYLPKADSYIVYEVEHETAPFSILVFRSTGRACYRFIDAPFQKKWLIDENGEVATEYKVISSRLGGGVYMSKMVDRYEQYRDIIYGNNKDLDNNFRRFQLMETKNYQNIYRSIQNVFLNSRLDGELIRDIIIRSMNEEEASINIGYFRGQVADFEQEYNDISKWYRTNAKGESPVRKQANSVIQEYHDLLYLKRQIKNLCGELNYAIRQANERKPMVEEKISSLTEERGRQQKLLEELQSAFDMEKADINKSIGVVDENLKKCREKRDFYTANNISQVIQRCAQKQTLTTRLESLQKQLEGLTSQYEDITAKFKKLIDVENNALETFRQTKEKERNLLAEQKLLEKEHALEEFNRRKEAIETLYADKLTTIQESVDTLKGEISECDKELYSLQVFSPYSAEIEEEEKKLRSLREKSVTLKGDISTNKAEIGKLQAEYEKSETETTAEFEQKIKQRQDSINQTKARIDELDNLLSRTKGSLYDWLSNNVQGWEKNIGKVISEENVLYRTGLQPQKSSADNTLYGISLDLSDLPMSVRKPDELKQRKGELESELANENNELAAIRVQEQEAIDSLKKQFGVKIKQLRESGSIFETELSTIPSLIKASSNKIEDLKRKTEEQREQKRSAITEQRNLLAHKIIEKEEDLKNTQSQKEAKLKEENTVYITEKTKIEEALKQASERLNTEIKNQETSTEASIVKLRQMELNELKGKGVDTSAVSECNANIESVKAELNYISAHEELVTRYNIDKEEYFDKEEEFKNDKNNLSDRLSLLKEKYIQKEEGYQKTLEFLGKEIATFRTELSKIEEGLNKAETFICDTKLCPPQLRETEEIKTLKGPAEIVNELIGIIVSRHGKQDSFKQNINIFKSNFSAKNTFKFKTDMATDEDYLDFASNLDEFIQNNKIEFYKNRTSERYLEILARVSAEIGDLTRHESDVEKIINEINADFKDRNFVTAIKLIALRSKPTSNKMVLLMKRIKEFNDDNQFSMGEVNLFTTSSKDDINSKAVEYIIEFMKVLNEHSDCQLLTLSDMFQLEFRVKENDNDTEWTSKLSHVGSEGTDTLVKAMVNIMLINVFKQKVSKKFGDFKIHCMMDEIGKLHPRNIKGILEFANSRNILLINSSPTTYNVSDYKYTYLLDKDGNSNTIVHTLISKR